DTLFELKFDKLASLGTLKERWIREAAVKVIHGRYTEIRSAGIQIGFNEFLQHCTKLLKECKVLTPVTEEYIQKIMNSAQEKRRSYLINTAKMIEREIEVLAFRKFLKHQQGVSLGNVSAFLDLFRDGYIGERSLR